MLKIVDPMINDFVRESIYVDVRKYKHLRITSFSDCNLSMDVCFSHNGVNEGPTSSYPLQANLWATRRVDVILPYIKIRIVRNEKDENKNLVVNVLGRYTPQDDHHDVKQEEVKVDEEVQPQQRSKSPFRSFVSKKKPAAQVPSQKIQVNDPRLPEFISKNSLLVGGFSNQIICVPAPTEDSHLCYRDGSFVWDPLPDKKITWKI